LRRIRIDRLQLDVNGLDAATVGDALRALPAALARRMAAQGAPVTAEPVRVPAGTTGVELAGRLASRLAGEVAARADGAGDGSGT
jgi:hypothetical protein